jgi:biotin carboxyl carrier protein
MLESMKLFASLAADISRVIVDVACRAGEAVPAGKRLMLIEAKSADRED